MSVEIILAGKGRDVVTMRPEETLGDAVRTLSKNRIGAIVVAGEAGTVLGIISERDVVRAIAESGGRALDESLSARMTTDVVTCTGQADLDDIMGLMTERKFRHVPVVDGGRLTGIVSIGDIVKHRLAEIEAEHKAMRDYIATA